ncbi:MAG: COX15/CtaA family protein [Thermodesulfobacteriota bacteirum]|jgi:cytochrome c oxidase assembly protein subunit 15|nr:COX15/CtaA family protein [Thermodesulfobacteriota bacterium]
MGRIEKLTLYSLVLLLLWGNMVSGLGAGLACPDWPLCFGSFFPEINFPIFMEHGHRVLGLFVTIFFALLARKRLKFYKGGYKLIPILCSILLAVQIIAGALVVILQLETNITTFHFANAIIIFILIYIMCSYTDSDQLKLINIFNKKNLPYLILFLFVYWQLVLGAYVRHSNAGLACPDFPRCLGYWLPPYLSKTVFVHLFHRISGVVILVISFWLFFKAYYIKADLEILLNLKRLAFLVLIQVVVGVFVVVSKLAFSMTAIHLLIALLIVGVILNLLFIKKEVN